MRSSVVGFSPTPSLFGVADVADARASADVVLNFHSAGDNGDSFLEVRVRGPALVP